MYGFQELLLNRAEIDKLVGLGQPDVGVDTRSCEFIGRLVAVSPLGSKRSSFRSSGAPFTADGLKHLVEHVKRLSGVNFHVHQFRHTFAVSHVAAWYAEGRDVNALLPTLSTYLGHISVENTRLYLTANGALLEQAAARFAHKTSALDEVQL